MRRNNHRSLLVSEAASGATAALQNVSFAYPGAPPVSITPPTAPSPAPAHAVQGDPWAVAAELLDQAVQRAARKLTAEARAMQSDQADRIALRRYGFLILGAAGALLVTGFALGLLYSAQGYACDTVSNPGWRVCSQWTGSAHGVVQGPGKAAR
jgi:hypothetical protein